MERPEIAALCRLKETSRADYLITTEKDAVKLESYRESLGMVYAAGLELRFADAGPLDGRTGKTALISEVSYGNIKRVFEYSCLSAMQRGTESA